MTAVGVPCLCATLPGGYGLCVRIRVRSPFLFRSGLWQEHVVVISLLLPVCARLSLVRSHAGQVQIAVLFCRRPLPLLQLRQDATVVAAGARVCIASCEARALSLNSLRVGRRKWMISLDHVQQLNRVSVPTQLDRLRGASACVHLVSVAGLFLGLICVSLFGFSDMARSNSSNGAQKALTQKAHHARSCHPRLSS